MLPEVADARVLTVGRVHPLGPEVFERGRESHGVVGEDLGRDRRALRTLRLVVEALHETGATQLDHSLGRCLRPRHLGGDDGAGGATVEVLVDDVAQVEGAHRVGAEDEDDIGAEVTDRVEVAIEVVAVALAETVLRGRAAALLGRQPLQPAAGPVEVPRTPVRDVLVQARRLELDGEPHVGDPAVRQRRQGEVHELVLPGIRQGRLGALAGEDVHAGALATRLNDRQHLGSSHHAPHCAARLTRRLPVPAIA